MKNKLIKTLSLCMTCLIVTLLLNLVSQKNNFKKLTLASTSVHIIVSPDEDAPWL